MTLTFAEKQRIVRLARAKIATPACWWNDSLAADAADKRVDFNDPSACRWSAEGAITLCAGGNFDSAEEVMRDLDVISREMHDDRTIDELDGVGHDAVLAVLDAYIECSSMEWAFKTMRIGTC